MANKHVKRYPTSFIIAAAKSLQSCLTLRGPIDGSPPGSPIPGILQARTLEWVAISFSNDESEKWKWSHSVMSNSQQPHGLQPTRFLCPWDFPGKSIGVGCHFLLQRIFPTYDLNSLTLYADTHLSYQGSPSVRMAIIKKSTDKKYWTGCGENGTLLHCWWECKLKWMKATMENSVEIPLKTEIKTAIWCSNPTAGHTHQENQNWKRHTYPSVHRSTVYNS